MKLLVKKEQIGENRLENLGTGTTSTTEIPSGTITWLTIIYVFVNVVTTSISKYIGESPQRMNSSRNFELNSRNIELREKNFRVQLLQRVLEIKGAEERKASLKLLIAEGLLNKRLEEFINDSNNQVPKWPHTPLEPLSSFLPTGSVTLGTATSGSPTSGTTPSVNTLPEIPLGTTPQK